MISEYNSNESHSDLSIDDESEDVSSSDDDSDLPRSSSTTPNIDGEGVWIAYLEVLGNSVAHFTSLVVPTNTLADDASPVMTIFIYCSKIVSSLLWWKKQIDALQNPGKIDCILDYWSNEETNQPYVFNMMPRNRFQELSKNLHLADNKNNLA